MGHGSEVDFNFYVDQKDESQIAHYHRVVSLATWPLRVNFEKRTM